MRHNGQKVGRRLLISTGLLLIAAALVITGYNLWSDHRGGIKSAYVAEELQPATQTRPEADVPGEASPPQQEDAADGPPSGEMPVQTVDGYDYIAVLDIPALGLCLPVMSEWDNTRLKIAPCRYCGSVAHDDLVIVAHNYKSHFGRLASLHEGDTVTLTDVSGARRSYSVKEIATLQPGDIETATEGRYPLTLITCTMGGKARLSVFCEAAASP